MNPTLDIVLPLLIGQGVTPAMDFLNRYIPNKKFSFLGGSITVDGSKARFIVALLICLGFGVLLNKDQLNFNDIPETLTTFGLIFASSQSAYKLWYEHSHAQEKIRNIN